MFNHDYAQRDIYTIHISTKEIERITFTDYDETYPVWAHTENVLFYTSDYQGVWNIVRHDFCLQGAVK